MSNPFVHPNDDLRFAQKIHEDALLNVEGYGSPSSDAKDGGGDEKISIDPAAAAGGDDAWDIEALERSIIQRMKSSSGSSLEENSDNKSAIVMYDTSEKGKEKNNHESVEEAFDYNQQLQLAITRSLQEAGSGSDSQYAKNTNISGNTKASSTPARYSDDNDKGGGITTAAPAAEELNTVPSSRPGAYRFTPSVDSTGSNHGDDDEIDNLRDCSSSRNESSDRQRQHRVDQTLFTGEVQDVTLVMSVEGQTVPPPNTRQRRRQRNLWIAGALTVLVIVISIGVALALTLGRRSSEDYQGSSSESQNTSAGAAAEWMDLVKHCESSSSSSSVVEAETSEYHLSESTHRKVLKLQTMLGLGGSAIFSDGTFCLPETMALIATAAGDGADLTNEHKLSTMFALACFFFSTNGPKWRIKTNWLSNTANVCSWYNVVCDADEQEVIGLIFQGDNNIRGEISSQLSRLSSLRDLRLDSNDITGNPLLDVVLKMEQLETVSFLESSISGSIPPEISRLANLRDLGIGSYSLVGSIPTEIGLLSSLTDFILNGNVEGAVPSEIGLLTGLSALYISGKLSGTFPDKIWKLPLLTSILVKNLGFQTFGGSLPEQVFENSPQYKNIQIFGTDFEGGIPSTIGYLTSLVYVNIFDNTRLGGSIPTEIGLCTGLLRLGLERNALRGSLPTEFGSLSSLVSLSLSGNYLTSTIPSELAKLRELSELRLDGGVFSGTLPAGVCSRISQSKERGVTLICDTEPYDSCPLGCCDSCSPFSLAPP